MQGRVVLYIAWRLAAANLIREPAGLACCAGGATFLRHLQKAQQGPLSWGTARATQLGHSKGHSVGAHVWLDEIERKW